MLYKTWDNFALSSPLRLWGGFLIFSQSLSREKRMSLRSLPGRCAGAVADCLMQGFLIHRKYTVNGKATPATKRTPEMQKPHYVIVAGLCGFRYYSISRLACQTPKTSLPNEKFHRCFAPTSVLSSLPDFCKLMETDSEIAVKKILFAICTTLAYRDQVEIRGFVILGLNPN